MGRDSFAEKRVAGAQAHPIKKLRRQQDIARGVRFLQTAHCRYANDPADIERTQRVNIRAMIQFVGEDAMPTSMSRQKINAAAEHCSANDGVRRRAERRLDLVFGQLGKILQVVEATAADNSDCWLVHPHSELKRTEIEN